MEEYTNQNVVFGGQSLLSAIPKCKKIFEIGFDKVFSNNRKGFSKSDKKILKI